MHIDVEGGGGVDGSHDAAHVERLIPSVVKAEDHVNLHAMAVVSTENDIWLLHNLIEARFDLFRCLLLGDRW